MIDGGRGPHLQAVQLGPRQAVQRVGGGDLVDDQPRARQLGQGQVPLQHDPLCDRWSRRDTQPAGELAFRGGSPFHEVGIGRAVGHQGVEPPGVGHDTPEHPGIQDRAVGVRDIDRARFVHQADLGHLGAVQTLGGCAGGIDVHQADVARAAQDEVDHRGIIDGRVGVRLDHDGGHPAGRRRPRRRLQRLLGLGAGLAGLDPDVDQTGRQHRAPAIHQLEIG